MLLIYRVRSSKDCVVKMQKHRGETKRDYVATYMCGLDVFNR